MTSTNASMTEAVRALLVLAEHSERIASVPIVATSERQDTILRPIGSKLWSDFTEANARAHKALVAAISGQLADYLVAHMRSNDGAEMRRLQEEVALLRDRSKALQDFATRVDAAVRRDGTEALHEPSLSWLGSRVEKMCEEVASLRSIVEGRSPDPEMAADLDVARVNAATAEKAADEAETERDALRAQVERLKVDLRRESQERDAFHRALTASNERVAEVEAQLAAVGATTAPLYTSQERETLLRRIEALTSERLSLRAEILRLQSETSRLHDSALAHQRWREKAEEQARKAQSEAETYRQRLALWSSPLPSDQIRVAEERGVVAGVAWERERPEEEVRALHGPMIARILDRLRSASREHHGIVVENGHEAPKPPDVPVPFQLSEHPTPWTIGDGYEQGDPGWYICDANGAVVVSLSDDPTLTRPEANWICETLSRAAVSDSASRPGIAPAPPLPDPSILDPGIRDVVIALREAGFYTTDSGDGTSKPRDQRTLDDPHVFAKVAPESLVSEARRLLHAAPALRFRSKIVEASFSPNDGIGVLSLVYRDDTPF